MNEKHNPDEILEDLLPEPELQELEEIFHFEETDGLLEPAGEVDEDALIEAIAAEVSADDAEIDEKMEFDLDAYLPEDPEEPEDSDVDMAQVELSSGYMDDYPQLPDSVEEPAAEPETPAFDDGGEFEAQFSKKQEPPKQPSVNQERHTRKGRPKRKKGVGLLGIPHLLATAVWLLLILAIGVSMGRFLWVCASDVLAFGREEKVVTVSITTEDTMETIADKLHKAGLVRYPELFLLYADLTDADEKITTGSFTLNTVYDYHALVNQMSPRSGNRVVIEDVLIPEGYSCRQIFSLLESKGICKVSDLESWAANGELDDYWFLEGVKRGDKYCLEGYLFPDTYDFYENSTPRQALEKMLDGFNYRFTKELYEALPGLNERNTELMKKNGHDEAYIAENQLDLRKLLTVASLIEEETASATESHMIASVIYNRLYNWGKEPPYLNIDAAIFYALGYHKESLSSEDLQIDSPYNTYVYTGLVPGPISNPGLDSIRAALDPEDSNYYYYVLDTSTGLHRFSKTYAEHQKNIRNIYGG